MSLPEGVRDPGYFSSDCPVCRALRNAHSASPAPAGEGQFGVMTSGVGQPLREAPKASQEALGVWLL